MFQQIIITTYTELVKKTGINRVQSCRVAARLYILRTPHNDATSNNGRAINFIIIGRLGPLTLAYFLASPRVKATRCPSSRFAIG